MYILQGGLSMSVKRILTMIGMGILGIMLIIIGFTTWYTVNESEQAVVITFGKANTEVHKLRVTL